MLYWVQPPSAALKGQSLAALKLFKQSLDFFPRQVFCQ
jgi:hypothetical protein